MRRHVLYEMLQAVDTTVPRMSPRRVACGIYAAALSTTSCEQSGIREDSELYERSGSNRNAGGTLVSLVLFRRYQSTAVDHTTILPTAALPLYSRWSWVRC